MPALPHLGWAAASASAVDKRVIDSRELRLAARPLKQALTHTSRQIGAHAIAATRFLRRDSHCPSGVIAECYAGLDAGPSPGAVAGIVLGSVGGFLLLLYILWILSQGSSFIRTTAMEEEEIVVRPAQHRRRRPRPQPSGETRERSPRRERVVVQERIIRPVEGSVPRPARPRSASRFRETETVEVREERRVPGDNEVTVEYDHSSISAAGPPPRRQSRRSTGGYR